MFRCGVSWTLTYQYSYVTWKIRRSSATLEATRIMQVHHLANAEQWRKSLTKLTVFWTFGCAAIFSVGHQDSEVQQGKARDTGTRARTRLERQKRGGCRISSYSAASPVPLSTCCGVTCEQGRRCRVFHTALTGVQFCNPKTIARPTKGELVVTFHEIGRVGP
jgi:hypothetical protein